jgi:hypothetical protein
MRRNNTHDRARRWFADFVHELTPILQAHAVGVLRADVQGLKEWADIGWYAFLARLPSEDRASFSLWFDRYLDDGSHHLGVWYSADRRTINALRESVARAWDVSPALPVYTHDDRTEEALLEARAARAERTRVPAPFIDQWTGKNETYIGLYVALAPHLTRDRSAVLDQVVGALRRLGDAVARHNVERRSSARPDLEQEIERIKRDVIARPEQARLRLAALDHHGGCIITGERAAPVLEAAHIHAKARGGPDHLDNALVLRADLHLLFDVGLITIADRARPVIRVSERLREMSPAYSELAIPKGAETITAAQWAALERRNEAWRDDVGIPRP